MAQSVITQAPSTSTAAAFRTSAISGNIGNSVQIAITGGIALASTLEWAEFFDISIQTLLRNAAISDNNSNAVLNWNTYPGAATPLEAFLGALATTAIGSLGIWVVNRFNLSGVRVPSFIEDRV